MRDKKWIFSWLIYLGFFLLLLPVSIFTYKNPAYNFDMLGYMALVYKLDNRAPIEEVHQVTYSSVRKSVPGSTYEQLTSTPAFRKRFANDPAEFEKLLPIYVVKPLYIWMSWGFYKMGFGLTTATVMPSIFAYLVIGMVLLFWMLKYLKPGFAFTGSLLVMYSLFTVGVAALSTPDCLSALFLFIASYFVIGKKNIPLMFLFLLLSVFARVDNIITSFFIISFLTFTPKWKTINKKQYLLMLGILCVAYLFIMLPVREYGWSIFYYSRYARQIDFSRNFEQSVTVSSYLALAYTKLVTAIVSSHMSFFLFLAMLVLAGRKFSFKQLDFDQSFLLLLLSVIVFRFFLLPDLSDRFYFGTYLVIIILIIKKIAVRNRGTEL
jgi:hypothetical protein